MAKAARKNIYLVSLGDPQNRVDSEVMVGLIQEDGSFEVVADVERADMVVVNTCGFIEAAKEESINTILEMVERKNAGLIEKVVISGGLAQRYCAELALEIPEVDAILGTQTFIHITDALKGRLAEKVYIQPGSFIMDHTLPRANTMRGGTAYLKIAEGCSRRCSYCVVPKIRGEQRSRAIEDVLAEAQQLGAGGVNELILLAQDMTAYGSDLGGHRSPGSLVRLLRALEAQATEVDWIRLLNLYPLNLSDELIDILQHSERILPYIDMPMQHVNQRILTSMARQVDRDRQMKLVERLRALDDLVLRTTFIVGYPGETDAEFQELYDWVVQARFDGVSVFTYSSEEGTAAAEMDGQVSQSVKEERRDALLAVQREIGLQKNEQWIGDVTQVIVDGPSEEHEAVLEGRHYGQAPDVDGVVYLSFENGGEFPAPGEIVDVEITQASEYDLAGVFIPPHPP